MGECSGYLDALRRRAEIESLEKDKLRLLKEKECRTFEILCREASKRLEKVTKNE